MEDISWSITFKPISIQPFLPHRPPSPLPSPNPPVISKTKYEIRQNQLDTNFLNQPTVHLDVNANKNPLEWEKRERQGKQPPRRNYAVQTNHSTKAVIIKLMFGMEEKSQSENTC